MQEVIVYIILVIVAAAIAYRIWHSIRHHESGCNCGCGKSTCSKTACKACKNDEQCK